MELDFLASLEDAEMSQLRQQSMDPKSGSSNFNNLASADPRSDSNNTVDLHLNSTSLEPLYLGLLLCLGSWYLVGFSAPIQ